MLGAFFGPPYRDWWLSYASNPEQVPQYRSHWLVRKSATRAFAGGFVQLIRRQPSMIEVRGWRDLELLPYALTTANSTKSFQLKSDLRSHSPSRVASRCWVIARAQASRQWTPASSALRRGWQQAFGISRLPETLRLSCFPPMCLRGWPRARNRDAPPRHLGFHLSATASRP